VKIVVGLGNPGPKYAETRHNVGWMVLDRLADRAGISGRGKERDAAITVRGRLADLDIVLVKPLTFMNDSGIAVRKILAREREPHEHMLVVVDDFALPFGRLRIRPDGTHGGHNGLRSIVAELETQRFARLRVGIGEPRRDAIDHVLSRFSGEERRLLPDLLDAAADAVETWAREGATTAANQWNGWTLGGAGTAAPASAAAAPASGVAVPSSGAAAPASRPPGQRDGQDGPPPSGREPGGARDARAHHDEAPAPGEIGGEAGPDGIRRTRTGWRRVLPHGRDRDAPA